MLPKMDSKGKSTADIMVLVESDEVKITPAVNSGTLVMKAREKEAVPVAAEILPEKVIPQDAVEVKVDDVSIKESEKHDLEGKDEKKKNLPLTILVVFLKLCCVLGTLYFFVCSLTLLSNAFQLLGGRAAGGALGSSLLRNPFVGLMMGILTTAILQSSSTSTSILITLVATNMLTVDVAIPIIMGSNIGTSVTAILVSVTQAKEREEFRRAFSAAVVHDMFNWLSVLILLPIEIFSGYLYHLTGAIVRAANITGGGSNPQFLNAITRPLTDLIVQLDTSVLQRIAAGDEAAKSLPLLRYWCETRTELVNDTTTVETVTEVIDLFDLTTASTPAPHPTRVIGITPCRYLFHGTTLSEIAVGVIVLFMALIILVCCLLLLVKILKSLLQGPLADVIKTTINADFPGYAAPLTGYVVMIVGAIATVFVQSSSVTVSTLTPLVGIGMVSVERVYPLMLGANIGTTSTAILASFAASGDRVNPSFQLAMCHLFFNLSGIILWYPIPILRRIPINISLFLGRITSQYRWFAVVFVLLIFVVIPMLTFGLSMAGWYVLLAVLVPMALFFIAIGVINVLQSKKPQWLPSSLRSWMFLPEPLRSLEPMDRIITRTCICCKPCQQKENQTDIEITSQNDAQSNENSTIGGVTNQAFINTEDEISKM